MISRFGLLGPEGDRLTDPLDPLDPRDPRDHRLVDVPPVFPARPAVVRHRQADKVEAPAGDELEVAAVERPAAGVLNRFSRLNPRHRGTASGEGSERVDIPRP